MEIRNELREPVIERGRGKCGNCGASVSNSGDVHRIVPRGKEGLTGYQT